MMNAKEAVKQHELSDVELNAVAGGKNCCVGTHLKQVTIEMRSGNDVIQKVMQTVFGR
jgi:hypothetical protein